MCIYKFIYDVDNNFFVVVLLFIILQPTGSPIILYKLSSCRPYIIVVCQLFFNIYALVSCYVAVLVYNIIIIMHHIYKFVVHVGMLVCWFGSKDTVCILCHFNMYLVAHFVLKFNTKKKIQFKIL